VLVYLNAVEEGGHTAFYAAARTAAGGAIVHQVVPVPGLAVTFDHRWWHEGQPVTAGFKYVLRTDVPYPVGQTCLP